MRAATTMTITLVSIPALAAVSFVLFDTGPMVWTMISTTLCQSVTPAHMLGRVSAESLTVNTGVRPSVPF